MTTIDRSSWNIKGQAIIKELVTLMSVTAEECALMKSMHAAATNEAPLMVEAFYTRLLAHKETHEYIGDDQKERLRGTLTQWFIDLFCGQYDEAYALKRLNIGVIHVRIGLPVRYPLAMMDIILQHGEKIAAPLGPTAVSAFRKILSLDVAVFNQAYEDEQLNSLAKTVGGERLARRLLSTGD